MGEGLKRAFTASKATRKRQHETRRLLTDSQCRVFLHSMRDFGYPSLTFDQVRRVADLVAKGAHSNTDVIAVIMAKQIDEAT